MDWQSGIVTVTAIAVTFVFSYRLAHNLEAVVQKYQGIVGLWFQALHTIG